MSRAIKLLLTELVAQCRNILPLAFSALTSSRSVNTEKAAGNIFNKTFLTWRGLHCEFSLFTQRESKVRSPKDHDKKV